MSNIPNTKKARNFLQALFFYKFNEYLNYFFNGVCFS